MVTPTAARPLIVPETDPIAPHGKHRDALYKHSGLMVKQGDRLQASEKLWGAVAHGLKIVAANRKWPYTAHADASVIVKHLQKTLKRRSAPEDARLLRRLFPIAEDLHRNFYTDEFQMEEIADRREDIRELLALLKRVNHDLPRDEPPPSENHAQYWRRARAAAARNPAALNGAPRGRSPRTA